MIIENPMVSTTETRVHFESLSPTGRCGCGRKASYLVYENLDPHCEICFAEAIDGSTLVPVRRFR